MLPKIDRREWIFVGLVIFTVLVLTTLPYIFAVLSTPPDRQFMGFVLNVSDHAQYLSWYKAFQTDYLISNRLTPEPNPPIFFNLLWWSLGRLGRYSGLSYVMVYQLFRWTAGAFFLVMVYVLAALVFASIPRRRTALLVITSGSGLGWFLVLLKYTLAKGTLFLPLDVYVAEGNTFLCILAYPHFAEAAGLILTVIWLLLVGEQQSKLRYAVYAGLVALFLGWQHAYDLLIVWGVPTAYAGVLWLLSRKWPSYWFKAMLITGLVSWPPALYSVLLTRLDPTWNQVLAQFANAGVYSPPPYRMLILMGLPLMVAIITLGLLARDRSKGSGTSSRSLEHTLFIVVWFIVGWALTYVPTDFQIHMINSWQAPVGLLATVTLFDHVIPALKQQRQINRLAALVIPVFIGLIIPTNIYLWMWRFVDLGRHDYPYYLYRDEVAAMEWIGNHTPPDSIVLSTDDTGQYIPGISGRRVFLGHWAQTVDYYGKKELVTEFFAATTDDAQRQRILRQFGVNYILYGQAEQALGSYTPDASGIAVLAFSSPHARVYAVKNQVR